MCHLPHLIASHWSCWGRQHINWQTVSWWGNLCEQWHKVRDLQSQSSRHGVSFVNAKRLKEMPSVTIWILTKDSNRPKSWCVTNDSGILTWIAQLVIALLGPYWLFTILYTCDVNLHLMTLSVTSQPVPGLNDTFHGANKINHSVSLLTCSYAYWILFLEVHLCLWTM